MAQKFLTDIELTRGLKDSSGDLGTSGQVLSSTGSALNWVDNTASASVVYQDGFTGNGSTTAFTLANSIDNENKTQVYIDGVYQHKDTYSLNGTTLTFSTAPPNTSDIEVISFKTVTADGDILTDSEFSSAGLMKTNGSGVYSIITDNSTNWNTAYTYSQVGHLPLAGGTVTGDLIVGGTNKARFKSDGTNTYVDAIPASSSIIFRNSGSIEKMRLNSSGNLGIGTTSPDSKLDVTGGDITVNTTGTGFMNFKYSGSQKGTIGTDGVDLKITANADLQLLPASNVGIGTASPSKKLHVYNTAAADVALLESTQVFSTLAFKSSTNTDTAVFGIDGGGNAYIENKKSTHPILFTTNSNERMRITSGGYVGIGTTSPAEKLEVSGSVKIGNLKIQNANSGRIGFNRNTATGAIYDSNSSAIQINGPSSSLNYLSIEAYNSSGNFTNQMVYTGSGNLGIGTTSPSVPLDVQGTAGLFITRTSGGLATYIENDGGYPFMAMYQIGAGARVLINTNGNSYFNGGNVGIGTSSPAQKLDVVGKMKISDDIILAQTNGRLDYDNGNSNGALRFHSTSGNAERMRITSGGNVGIGTTSPVSRFEVLTIDSNRYIRFKAPNGEDRFRFYTGGTGNASRLDMYSSDGTTRNVQISAGGHSYFNAGNIGIGTTSPDAKLHIQGGSSDQKVLEISTAQSDGPYTAYKNTSSGTTTLGFIGNSQGIMNAGNTNFGIRANNDLTFSSGGATERMRIKSNGRVGINTTNPLELLNVHQTTTTAGLYMPISIAGSRYQADYAVGIAFRPENNSGAYAAKTALVGSGAGYGYNMADLHFCFNNSTTISDEVSLSDAKVTMKRSGNVGIGTTAPTYKLQVNGTGYINETLYVNGETTVDDTLKVTDDVGIGTTSPIAKLDIAGNVNQHHTVSTAHNGGWKNIQNLGSSDWLDQTYSAGRLKVFGYENGSVNVSYCEYYVIRHNGGYALNQIGTRLSVGNGHGSVDVQISGNFLQVKNALNSSLGIARVVFSGMKD